VSVPDDHDLRGDQVSTQRGKTEHKFFEHLQYMMWPFSHNFGMSNSMLHIAKATDSYDTLCGRRGNWWTKVLSFTKDGKIARGDDAGRHYDGAAICSQCQCIELRRQQETAAA